MILIAHRGNVDGRNPQENNPLYLEEAIKQGFHVETDVWHTGGKFYLGHDAPMHPVNLEFLRRDSVWAHAKTVDTFAHLVRYPDVNVFYQDTDLVALTSRGYLWNHAKNRNVTTKGTVLTIVEHDGWLAVPRLTHGVCSDYVMKYRHLVPPVSDLPFDLLVIDIDGVMTDSTKVYGRNGRVIAKNYSDLDFTAIKRFRAAGIKVCFLSGDTAVNEAMARSRKIDFVYGRDASGNIDKAAQLPGLCLRYGTTPERVAYVGDDYYDLSIMAAVGHSFCPSNAPSVVQRTAGTTLRAAAGTGVIAALYDMYETQIPPVYPEDSHAQNPR